MCVHILYYTKTKIVAKSSTAGLIPQAGPLLPAFQCCPQGAETRPWGRGHTTFIIILLQRIQ